MKLLAPGYVSLGETQYCLSKQNLGPDRFGEKIPEVVVNGPQDVTFIFTKSPTESASGELVAVTLLTCPRDPDGAQGVSGGRPRPVQVVGGETRMAPLTFVATW